MSIQFRELLGRLTSFCGKLLRKKSTEKMLTEELENIASGSDEEFFKDSRNIPESYREKSIIFFSRLEKTEMLLSSERYIVKKWAEKAFKRFDIPGYPYFAVVFLVSNISCESKEKLHMIVRYLEYISEYILEQDALKLFQIKNTCERLDEYENIERRIEVEDIFEKILRRKEREYVKKKRSSIFLRNLLCTIIGSIMGFSVCFYWINLSNSYVQQNSISISKTQEFISDVQEKDDALQNTSGEGSTVTFSVSAMGGVENYKYDVYYKQKTQAKWTIGQNFKENLFVSVKLRQAADYDVCVKIKDKDGTIEKKYFTVTVK